MKVAIYAGGFKPFTTGHFSKLADAISAHQGEADEVFKASRCHICPSR